MQDTANSTLKQGLNSLYDWFTGDDEDARVCKDIPEAACRHQPRNFFAYLFANLMGKIADELASARLILPWLLSALGAPSSFAGFLVPIREAGVLLPQLLVAAVIRRMARRKRVWLLGAALSGLAMLLMAITAYTLSGVQAGWLIIAMLMLYSIARGLCSVSAKDVLGKTVSKTRRGALMGYSVAISSLAMLGLGIYLQQLGGQFQSIYVFCVLLLGAAAAWMVGLLIFNTIREEPGATEDGGNALQVAIQTLGLLKTDLPLRRFVILRALLLSVALLPPFLVMLAQQHTADNISSLGWLLIANSIAGALSAVVWGKLSDRSSRLVMLIGSLLCACTGLLVAFLAFTDHAWLTQSYLHAGFFLLISIAHGGVRLGRKVYLVDMADTNTRSSYVAVSNTVIGFVMLLAGSVGIIADLFSTAHAIALLSVISLIAAIYATNIKDVSG